MADSIELYRLTHVSPRGTTTAVVAPAWGANIVGFAFQPKELLWPVSFLELVDPASLAAKPTSYGAPLLGPTPGRVGSREPGSFTFDGRVYRMAHSRHGFLRHLPWSITERSASAITCAVEVSPSEAIGHVPFAFRAEHRVALSEGRLDARIVFRSTADGDQPLGFGWHPYLQRDPGCRLLIPAASRWEVDGSDEPVPTGRRVPVSGLDDFRAGRTLGPAEDEPWDTTLADLSFTSGVAECVLESEPRLLGADGKSRRWAVRRVVEVRDGDAAVVLPNIQLYTAPGRAALAVEPFSCPPDAVNLLARGREDTGLVRLKPGQEAAFAMSLRVDLRVIDNEA